MFKRHYQKRSPNILFVIFRLCLSMFIFAVLLGGVYSAYKHFSGFDPFKLDPQTLISSLIKDKSPKVLNQFLNKNQKILGMNAQSPMPSPQKNSAIFSFLIVADSHSEDSLLEKAISQAKEKNADLKFIIGMGDYTNVGTIAELKSEKQVFDASSLRYFLVPGDHDFWDSRDKNSSADTNFIKVFGPTYQSFVFDNFRFLILNNADNYTGMDTKQLAWLDLQLSQAKNEGNKAAYIFMHEPLYHPSSDHVMGFVNQDLKASAKTLIHTLKDAGVSQVFFGHVHFFSRYTEPESSLGMTVVGALTTQANAQAPRYAIVSVFEDGSLGVEDIEVK